MSDLIRPLLGKLEITEKKQIVINQILDYLDQCIDYVRAQKAANSPEVLPDEGALVARTFMFIFANYNDLGKDLPKIDFTKMLVDYLVKEDPTTSIDGIVHRVINVSKNRGGHCHKHFIKTPENEGLELSGQREIVKQKKRQNAERKFGPQQIPVISLTSQQTIKEVLAYLLSDPRNIADIFNDLEGAGECRLEISASEMQRLGFDGQMSIIHNMKLVDEEGKEVDKDVFLHFPNMSFSRMNIVIKFAEGKPLLLTMYPSPSRDEMNAAGDPNKRWSSDNYVSIALGQGDEVEYIYEDLAS